MTGSRLSRNESKAVVAPARAGDESAFTVLVSGYRMLGSFENAEDMVQDTLLRAWRNVRGFEGRSSIRSWLYRIVTNACLDALSRRLPRVAISGGRRVDAVGAEVGEVADRQRPRPGRRNTVT